MLGVQYPLNNIVHVVSTTQDRSFLFPQNQIVIAIWIHYKNTFYANT